MAHRHTQEAARPVPTRQSRHAGEAGEPPSLHTWDCANIVKAAVMWEEYEVGEKESGHLPLKIHSTATHESGHLPIYQLGF